MMRVKRAASALLFSLLSMVCTVPAQGIECYECHGTMDPVDIRPLDSEKRDSVTGGFLGNHRTHVAGPVTDPSVCAKCHPGSDKYQADHQDGRIKLSANLNSSFLSARYKNITSSFAQTAQPALGTCTNVNCHFENTTLRWGTGRTETSCSSCHPAPPADGTHSKHDTIYGPGTTSCAQCHADHMSEKSPFAHATSAGKRNLTTRGFTYSKSENLAYPNYLPSRTSAASRNGTCSSITCHGGGSATWGGTPGSLKCLDCHTLSVGSRAPVGQQFTGNSHHVQGVAVSGEHCYQCHWEANSDGSINSAYHRSGTPGSPVELVIRGSGGRPSTYVPGTTAVQYTADGSREQVEKITGHCLGCHDDTNMNSTPFGDGVTPAQYSWDRTSVAARYTQTGGTSWGKYTSAAYPNIAKKKIRKAFSAHGNAADNQRGWDTTNGVDGAIANTSGATNVQCYDCHNSHGSQASGVTSQYSSATGRKRGGLLKNTAAGVGGYAVGYVPSAGGAKATGNSRNAGGSLCLDCHLNQTAATTPWGFTSTFGATQPVIGYWDTSLTGSGGTGAADRYEFKGANAARGGHFGAYTSLSTPAMKTIEGICTPCHDPHGVSPTADGQYAVPLLKGTWVTSPYKEDTAPAVDTLMTIRTDLGYQGAPYHIDQNTFGSDLKASGTVAGMDEPVEKSAGLCLGCHPKESLTADGGQGSPNPWKSKARIHESVKGWKTSNATVKHNYSCSKCHSPHSSSLLPRLMVTNCLNSKHKGRVPSNASPVTSGSGEGGYGWCSSLPSSFYGWCTSRAGSLSYYGKGGGRIPGSWRGDKPGFGDHSLNCHEGQGGDQSWNSVTQWTADAVPGPANTAIWTTKGDFENNVSTTKSATTLSQVEASGLYPSDNATVRLGLSRTTTIAASNGFSVAVKADGSVWAWGTNTSGQLGDGTATQRLIPVPVQNLGSDSGVVAVSAGVTHALALKADGSVMAWGANDVGQLGDGTTVPKNVPIAVPGLVAPADPGQKVIAVSTSGSRAKRSKMVCSPTNVCGTGVFMEGGTHSLALKADGSVWAWGNNQYGQIGNGTTVQQNTPIQIIPPAADPRQKIMAVSAGGSHSLALRADGSVLTWGINWYGWDGQGPVPSLTPVQISGLGPQTDSTKKVVAISAGGSHSLALKADGSVWAWGMGESGQIGNGSSDYNQATPVNVSGLVTGSGVVAVSAGGYDSFAVKSNGEVWAWGGNWSGQLGDGSTTLRKTPVKVMISGMIETGVSAGETHTVAVQADGTLLAWGDNTYGQLGDNTKGEKRYPVPVSISAVSAQKAGTIASAASRSVVVNANGTVSAWGLNRILSTGISVAFGDLVYGGAALLNQPIPRVAPVIAGVVSLSAGTNHTLAVKSDGSVIGWGARDNGKLSLGNNSGYPNPVTGLGAGSGAVAVAAGDNHSLAVKADGSVLAWGSHDRGQLGTGAELFSYNDVPAQPSGLGPNPTNPVIAVAAGFRHSLALKADGSVWAWGDNSAGQLGDGSNLADPQTILYKKIPVPVENLGPASDPGQKVVAIAAGRYHSLALRANGEVWAWGTGSEGQLGTGGTPYWSSHPTLVLNAPASGPKVIGVAAGTTHSLALRNDGSMLAWGDNSSGQLGDNSLQDGMPVQSRLVPYPVQNVGAGSGVVAVAAGDAQSLALKNDGTMLAWGANNYGQAGNGSVGGSITPAPVTNDILGIFSGVKSPLLYLSSGSITNLKYNATNRVDWSTLSWNGSTPANTSVLFRTRGADTEEGLGSAAWNDLSGSVITTPDSQWLEIEMTLQSTDGTSSPTVDDFTVKY